MATNDTAVTIAPYFKISAGKVDQFKSLCEKFVEKTQDEENVLFYGFSFDGDLAHCRECYGDADGLLTHLDSVAGLIVEAFGISELSRLEIHGPAAELEKLKEPLAEMNPQYFVLEYGFRR